jgi:hypothetical protein
MVTVPSFSAGAIGSQAYTRRGRPNPLGVPGSPHVMWPPKGMTRSVLFRSWGGLEKQEWPKTPSSCVAGEALRISPEPALLSFG